MKILVVSASLRRGGTERVVSRLTAAWSRDHSVTLALFNAAERAYPHGGELLDLGVPAARGALRKLRAAIRRTLLLRRLLVHSKPDRIFSFGESANLPLILAALLSSSRNKVTLSVSGNPDRMQAGHKLLGFLLYRWAGRIVAVSQGTAGRLAGGFAGSRVRVLDSPLDLDEITDRSGFLPAPEAGRYFFAAGRLVPGKDFARLIRIFASCGLEDVRLVIAGGGPERQRLESIIRDHGLQDRVRLAGETDNPFAYMKNALAFLMASRHEGFPMVLIEALACGCPVVAFDCDFGPREVTEDGASGFIVPLHDDALFAARLSQLAGDPDLRQSMSGLALRRARDFELQKVADQWLRLP
jgi:glycosyltransferase involved in cell wall biosynthesis